MIQSIKRLLSAPFQLVLVISFSLIAALSIAIGTWAITISIEDYLTNAMNERVERDMQLAEAFYDLSLNELQGIALRISQDPQVYQEFNDVLQGDVTARSDLDEKIQSNLIGLATEGNHNILVLDQDGEIITGSQITIDGEQHFIDSTGNWQDLPIFQQTRETGEPAQATIVIPGKLLAMTGLDKQAEIKILDTPKAADNLYDPLEGTAGLALVGTSPIHNSAGEVEGVVLAFHLFNNDFTLADRIKNVAGIDTATIFFGDLRVSTNVMTPNGERAIGTRVSDEVSEVVLYEGKEFVGPAFVVNQNYITRYDPIRDQLGNVIGILYVGAKQSGFNQLLSIVNQRILLVGIGTFLLVFLLALPVSIVITRPLNQLKDLVEANRSVGSGDLSVRVPVRSPGEVGMLAASFNTMLDTLQITQDQLVQSEKLASLGQLAAGVAHELNNPLGTILLYSDILLKEIDSDSPYKADLEVIVNETKRCKTIVSSLLEFARQNQVNAQPVNFNDLVSDTIEVERKRYSHLNIDLISSLDPTLPAIQADPNQLYQVLINLIDNSVDAMPDGGTITLTTRNHPPGMVTLEVLDTGTGISEENMGKLFTPFFTTKPVGKGTGLGLAIIYGIIKMHRGQINVRSKVGQGTTFTIQLPQKLQGNHPSGMVLKTGK